MNCYKNDTKWASHCVLGYQDVWELRVVILINQVLQSRIWKLWILAWLLVPLPCLLVSSFFPVIEHAPVQYTVLYTASRFTSWPWSQKIGVYNLPYYIELWLAGEWKENSTFFFNRNYNLESNTFLTTISLYKVTA